MASWDNRIGARAADLRASADDAYMRISRVDIEGGLEQREMRSILGLLERLIVDLEVFGTSEFPDRRQERNSES